MPAVAVIRRERVLFIMTGRQRFVDCLEDLINKGLVKQIFFSINFRLEFFRSKQNVERLVVKYVDTQKNLDD